MNIIVAILITSIFFYAGMQTNSSDFKLWKFIVDLSTVGAGLGTLGTLVVAYRALYSWKQQMRFQVVHNTSIELEDLVSRYIITLLPMPDEKISSSDWKKAQELFLPIKLLCWRLIRRDFNKEVVSKLEKSVGSIIDYHKKHGHISPEIIDEIINNLEEFSLSLNK
ncbi:hypothetical protein QSC59_000714 [Vibrio alginolyticus]|nr:hypothetical protein [Vibrio alginolyticus]